MHLAVILQIRTIFFYTYANTINQAVPQHAAELTSPTYPDGSFNA